MVRVYTDEFCCWGGKSAPEEIRTSISRPCIMFSDEDGEQELDALAFENLGLTDDDVVCRNPTAAKAGVLRYFLYYYRITEMQRDEATKWGAKPATQYELVATIKGLNGVRTQP